jgi:hypothetical protein
MRSSPRGSTIGSNRSLGSNLRQGEVEEREVSARERKMRGRGLGRAYGEAPGRAPPGLGRGGPRHGLG